MAPKRNRPPEGTGGAASNSDPLACKIKHEDSAKGQERQGGRLAAYVPDARLVMVEARYA